MAHEWYRSEGRLGCQVKDDVAAAAYPVVSLGKMIEFGFTFSFCFDNYKCYMHKRTTSVWRSFAKGRIFVLRMRRRWLKSTALKVAPIDEIADEEMGVAE